MLIAYASESNKYNNKVLLHKIKKVFHLFTISKRPSMYLKTLQKMEVNLMTQSGITIVYMDDGHK